ncbi:MAG: HEPN domain-containing protein [Candidatus Aenigmarchaeota archaeon]|nr:HEPN domain-containing protein [Candidatus Aenigmarchaeota archaeon]
MKEDTQKWLWKAEKDFATAMYNFEGGKLDAAAFYSQQSAEKALKALQIERLGRFAGMDKKKG